MVYAMKLRSVAIVLWILGMLSNPEMAIVCDSRASRSM